MSWEEMYTYKATCPCGKGKIIQKHYGDDWNRFQDGPVVIECEECAGKYTVEEVVHSRLLTSDGDWSSYYLTPKDYPPYTGISESSIFPPPANEYADYPAWLIENYTEDELKHVLLQLRNTTSSVKLSGIAAQICKSHKKAKNTVRVSEIMKSVEAALDRYPKHNGTKSQRDRIREQAEGEQAEYTTEKQKHQILINFER